MKDYSTNSYDQKKYILSYKIENGKIVAKLASGELYTIPYNEENEQAVISKMEMQARNATTKPLQVMDKVLSITQPLILPIAIANFINNVGWFYGIILAVILGGAIVHPAKRIINAIKERDIRKLNYFLDNQQELNDNVDKSENMLLNVSKKAVEQIKSEQSHERKPFSINNIDNYSLKDLRTLKENIERISSFGFNEEESILENSSKEPQGPVLKKTLDQKKK